MSKVLQQIQADLPIVVVYDDQEDIEGVLRIVKSCTKNYRALSAHQETQHLIESIEPKILMIALSDISESIEYYAELIKQEFVNYIHKAVILCDNKSAGIAFDSCTHGLFDDYCVAKPLYEKYRLKMIIYNAMLELDFDKREIDKRFKSSDELNASLDSIISLSADMKKNALGQLEEHLDEDALDAIDKNMVDSLNKINENTDKIKSAHQDVASDVKSEVAQKQKQAALADELIQSKIPSVSADLINPLFKDKNVLVAEDNPIYRKLVVTTLQNNGFRVTEAANGLEVIAAIESSAFDAVILDLFMPELDGIEVTEKIRRMDTGGDVPIIALTGNSDKEYVMSWLSVGLTSYLVKPSSKQKILAEVEKILKKT